MMNVQMPAPATGRRKVTREQLEATSSLTGHFCPTSPGHVLAAFKKAAPVLGYSRSLVDLIDYLTGRTIAADWQGEWKPIVWPSNAEMADRLDREISRIKELIREAIDAGLILPVDHGTRKRFGRRDPKTGRILYAYGFDLSPLAEKMPEFQQAAAEFDARRAEAKELRQEISHQRAAVLDLAALAESEGNTSLDWQSQAEQAKEAAASVKNVRDPIRLAPVVARLRTLRQQAEEALKPDPEQPVQTVENNPAQPEHQSPDATADRFSMDAPVAKDAGEEPSETSGKRISSPPSSPPMNTAISPLGGFPMVSGINLQTAQRQAGEGIKPAPYPVQTVENHPAQPENRPLNTTTNQLPIGKPITKDVSRQAHETGQGRVSPLPPKHLDFTSDPFRGFPMTPKIVLQIAPMFRDLVPASQPNWPQISEAAHQTCGHLGISQHAYGQACAVLGRTGAATAIAIISAKHQDGLVRSPGGLLRYMVEAHQNGTLRLDRTIFGLLDKTGGIKPEHKRKTTLEPAEYHS